MVMSEKSSYWAKKLGTVPSDPFVLKEKWFKVRIYLDYWPVVLADLLRAWKDYI